MPVVAADGGTEARTSAGAYILRMSKAASSLLPCTLDQGIGDQDGGGTNLEFAAQALMKSRLSVTAITESPTGCA
jgi:hypothetical protein